MELTEEEMYRLDAINKKRSGEIVARLNEKFGDDFSAMLTKEFNAINSEKTKFRSHPEIEMIALQLTMTMIEMDSHDLDLGRSVVGEVEFMNQELIQYLLGVVVNEV